jgi:hypothetical protein
MENGGFAPVAFNGVHHPRDYAPPMAGNVENLAYKISSPSHGRKPLKGDRVIASNLAGPSTSASVFDLPDRKNVLQIDVPTSTTKNISYNYNSQRNIQEPNLKLQFHGTESVSKKTYHGKFIELKTKIRPSDKAKARKAKKAKLAAKKKLAKRVNNVTEQSFKKAKDEALKIAKHIEKTTGALVSKVHIAPNKLVIPVHTTNKRENNNLQNAHKQV